MSHNLQFYIDGAWVDPVAPKALDVIDPSNEDAFAQISLGSKADVDKAVAAARRASSPWIRRSASASPISRRWPKCSRASSSSTPRARPLW